MRNTRRRKKSSALPTLIILVLALGIIIFVITQVGGSLFQRTAEVTSGNLGNQYKAQAVIVRDETLTDAEGLTRVKYSADEGEYLYKGGIIAQVYASGYSQTDINKLANTRASIKEHLKIALNDAYTDVRRDRLDSQVMDYVREIGLLVQNGDRGNLVNMERQLSSAMSSRQAYLKEKYASTDTTLMALYDDETQLNKKIQTWTTTHLADRECIVSFYTDGYETILTPAVLDSITIGQVRSVLAGDAPTLTTSQRGRTAIFRQVNPTGWYALLLSTDKNWSPVVGEQYELRLSSAGDTAVVGQVESYSRAGNDLLVRMQVTGDVRPVLNLRTTEMTVGQLYAAALQVPLKAIRQQSGQTGVVRTDQGGMFVPVTIVDQNHEYAFVQPIMPGALVEGQKVRVF